MNLVCLDLEGVLVPEIWIAVAEATGIDELRLTTRDISDYDELMMRRLGILEREGIKLPDIQEVIGGLSPLEGAASFLDALRSRVPVILLSDTFEQFASPLMRQLGWPTLLCNRLEIDAHGCVSGYRLRQADGKRRAVEGFRNMGFRVFAAGDSYNDVSMLKAAQAGILFKAPESIKAEFPGFGTAETHDELLAGIQGFLDLRTAPAGKE